MIIAEGQNMLNVQLAPLIVEEEMIFVELAGTEIDWVPTQAGQWEGWDLSSFVPAGTKCVEACIINKRPEAHYFGIRTSDGPSGSPFSTMNRRLLLYPGERVMLPIALGPNLWALRFSDVSGVGVAASCSVWGYWQ